ncbi:MAG: MetQ/NlpA family ABC transporter substrate-binding protein [Arachnia propionica]|uniref:MetQ/NlpA family ABC transporter substrate-binding protein n=1 Tax=Arachnia propionica TaxID=1750 RepID=UPI002705A07D|nr:MetQ/NlpA family ABC transporter substrate-binding protein [Arachnia propionica]
MRKHLSLLAASLAAAIALTACGGAGKSDDTTSSNGEENTRIVVGASPVPHARILEYVRDNLAAEAGIEIEIREFDDYVLPNSTLADGTLDANYFQHLPYLEAEIADKGYRFSHGEGIHIEPYALFSSKFGSAAEVTDGATVAITNDASNQYRALKLLEKAGLLTDVTEGTSVLTLTPEQNPRGLTFEENQPEIIIQVKDDPAVDLAIINGNFILTAGLSTEGALEVEEVAGNPYANFLTWRTDDAKPAVAKLDELLHSDEVKEFIRSQWPNGDVTPA